MAVTESKKAIVAQMKETLSEAKGAVLIGYSGLTVAQATELRRKMLAEGVEYKVIKNTLTRIAANELNLEGFSEHLEGPTALATSKEDAVAPARVIEQFIKATEQEVVTVKAGIVEGEVMDAAGVKAIASLPNREGIAFHVAFRIASTCSQRCIRCQSCCRSSTCRSCRIIISAHYQLVA